MAAKRSAAHAEDPRLELAFEVARGALGTNLRAARARAGLTQGQVAEVAGVSLVYYAMLEAGRSENPSLRMLAGIALALGAPLHELFVPAPLAPRQPAGRPITVSIEPRAETSGRRVSGVRAKTRRR